MIVEAIDSTPILSEKDFAYFMPEEEVVLDDKNLFRPLEMIAFEGSFFQVIDRFFDSKYNKIYQVVYDDYPSSKPLYIDSRFVKLVKDPRKPKIKKAPQRDKVLEILYSLIGFKYVWGGNMAQGVDVMQSYYPLKTKENRHHRVFSGVDCSGLMYYAAHGFIPRNTYEMQFFGNPVEIENLRLHEIIKKLRPLDMVVWKGHVFYILDTNTAIEARACRGCVYITDIKERFEKIFIEDGKIAQNIPGEESGYVVRRWAFL